MLTTYLDINGLNIKNADFLCWVSTFGNLDRDIKTNETYSDGVTYNRSKTSERKFLLNGFIKDRANIDALKQILFSNKLKVLTVGIAGMPTVTLLCDLLSFTEDANVVGIISAQMIAPDPYLYSVDTSVVTLGALSNNSLVFPFTFPITFGDVTGGQGTVTNSGNALGYPVITIIGTCSNLIITNTTTGESMTVNISLGATDVLVIDNNPRTRSITLNGINRMDLKVGNWITCPPGDNVFSFSRNSLEMKNHCSISLTSRWY